MTINELRQLYEAAPFHPFEIGLTNGRAVPVKHPEFMALSPTGRTVTVYESAASEMIDVRLIVSVRQSESGMPQRKRKR
ncbi:MAG: hypothetical protein H0X73_09250 [Chthoniobacterales bacterium]|nr:hypothetical protein [Chthoniobacterales bacterium]